MSFELWQLLDGDGNRLYFYLLTASDLLITSYDFYNIVDMNSRSNLVCIDFCWVFFVQDHNCYLLTICIVLK